MVVILGAGPAGIAAGYVLNKSNIKFQIIEKDTRIGGLCKSFEVGGATFDYGGHAFFTNMENVNNLLTQDVKFNFYSQQRRAWVHSHDTYLPYPFQANLAYLPKPVIAECLVGLFEAGQTITHSTQDRTQVSLHDWIHASFGTGIAKHFLEPYNKKIWTFPLNTIYPFWASERIVQPKFNEIIEGAIIKKPFTNFPNNIVRYSRNGGFEEIFKQFGNSYNINRFIQKGTIIKINPDPTKKIVILEDGRQIQFDKIISTLPLNELVNIIDDVPEECIKAAQKLKYFGLNLVNITVAGSKLTKKQRVYSADPNIPFHKLVINSNSSPSLRNLEVFGFQAEVSFSNQRSVSTTNLIEEVYQSLLKLGLITHANKVIDASIVSLPMAYPVYDTEWATSREVLFDFLKSHNIFCAGRFGEWLYINSDKAIERGLEAAKSVMAAQ